MELIINGIRLEPKRYAPGGFAYLVDEQRCPNHNEQKIAVSVSNKCYQETCYKCGWKPQTHEERIKFSQPKKNPNTTTTI